MSSAEAKRGTQDSRSGEQEGPFQEPVGRLILSDRQLATARRYWRGRLLLTPNDRAASAVREATSEGLSVSGLAERQLEESGWGRASEVVQLLALRRASAAVSGDTQRWAAAGSLGAAVRELLRAGLGRDEALAHDLAEAHGLAERSRLLVQIALRYREELAELRLCDAAEVLWRAARSEQRPQALLVTGYPRLGEAELEFIAAAAGPGSVVVLSAGYEASAAAAQRLAGAGWEVIDETATDSRSEAVTGDDRRRLAAQLPDQEAEVRHALSRVKALLLGGVPQGAVTIVARDERLYGPLVAAVAGEFDISVKFSYALAVRDTRLGQLLGGVITAVGEGLRFEATAKLLAQPLWRALVGEPWAQAREQHPAGMAAWHKVTAAVALLDWPSRGELRHFRDSLNRLVEESGAAERFNEREQRAWQRLERSLTDFDQSSLLNLAGFLALLDELLGLLSVSVDPPAKQGVEFHSPLAVFGASYQHVFVLGAAEGQLPAPLANDPLLDFFERDLFRAHGLPLEDAEGAAERETLSFLAAAATASTTLQMSYPALLDNREQLPSPFFSTFGFPPPRAPEPRSASGALERLMLTLRHEPSPARSAWEVELRRESDAAPDEFDGAIGVRFDVASRLFSASQLATLGQCSFRWFAQRGLHLEEPKEAEEDVSPARLGSIYHKTLELVTRHASRVLAAEAGIEDEHRGWDEAAAARFREVAIERLDAAFTFAEEAEGAPKAASWPLRRGEHLAKLTRVINAPDFLLPDTEVTRLEEFFEGDWRGFTVRGYVDRVDEGSAGVVLTDYKTGKRPPLGAKNSRGEPKLDLQLPLYAETAARLWFGDKPSLKAVRYFSINGAGTLMESISDQTELELFAARAKGTLTRGDFPVDPDVDQQVCTYCPYDAVCRRGPRLGRKALRAAEESAS